MHLTVVILLCVELINVKYDLSVCEQENAGAALYNTNPYTHLNCA